MFVTKHERFHDLDYGPSAAAVVIAVAALVRNASSSASRYR
jgi:hypothetical protein